MTLRPLLALPVLVSACGVASPPLVAPRQPAPARPSIVATTVTPAVPAPRAPVVDTEFLRAYVESAGFSRGAPRSVRLTPDGLAALFLRSQPRDKKQSLFEIDIASGAVRELLAPEALDKGPEELTVEERARRERLRITSNGFTAFDLSRDGRTVILSLSGKLYALDRMTGKTHPVNVGKGAVIDPHLSPDGRLIAYVQNDDVVVTKVDGSGDPRKVTVGGTEQKTHGLADFAAAEELDRSRGFWWSPDSSSILYEEADVRGVEHFTIADPAHPERTPDRFAYPRAGHTNAGIRLGITRLGANGATSWLDWDHAMFPYVAKVTWTENAPPSLFALDRLQKNGAVLAADPKTGKTRELLHEHDDAWLNVNASVPRWLADGSAFLFWSERDGDSRYGLVPATGSANVKWLTPKGMQASELLDVDLARRIAAVEVTRDGLHFEVATVSLDGGELTTVAKRDDGYVRGQFEEGMHNLFVAYEGSLSDVRHVFVRSLDGKVAREIPSIAETPRLPHVEVTAEGPDGAHVALVRPRGFVPGARYALIDSAYGGPHANVVSLDATRKLLEQWMADATGAIVVAIDAKGTPGRGRAWERALAGKLGDVPLDGHVEAIEALVASHPEIDGARVGVYGWSFGGYFASLAVLKRPDVYRAAVAIAPVSDWRDYDTAYTERYLGLPEANAAAYDAASLLSYARAPRTGSGSEPTLLVAHGTADDNVYFLHSLGLVDALEKGGRAFTFLPLAGQTHQIATPELQGILWARAAASLRDGLAR